MYSLYPVISFDMMWYDWYDMIWYDMIYDMIYLLTAIGLTVNGSSTVRIYTQTIHRGTQLTTRTTQLIREQHS